MRWFLPVLLPLSACIRGSQDDAPLPEDTAVTEETTARECDPVVQVPTPFVQQTAGTTPDPHSADFGSEPEPFHVHISWPATDPSTSLAWLWRTDLDTRATVVEYGVGTALSADDLDRRIEGASFRYGGAVDAGGEFRMHEVKLCGGLEPETTYSYRVGGEGHWSPVYEYTTPPAPGTFETFRIGVAGDSRGSYETWNQVVTSLMSHDPDFILFSGDMVEWGTDQAEYDAWFDATEDYLTHTALLPAHGNHEFLATNYFAQWSLPNNEEWFTIEYGSLQLTMLNDFVRDESHTSEQADYLDTIYGDSAFPWRFASHHRATYSTSTAHGSKVDLREAWEPAFERNGIDVVLAGHNHTYERSVSIRDGQEVEMGQGTLYLVSGGAGAPLYTGTRDEWFGNVAEPAHHYVIMDFSPAGVDAVVRDLSGNVIDEFTIPAP